MIKDKLPTLRSAVQAMIDGLKGHKELGLTVRMETFGVTRGEVCFGCAATATLLKSGVVGLCDYGSMVRRDLADGKEEAELRIFETAIDSFRYGEIEKLFQFYGVPLPAGYDPEADCLWYLNTDNWEEQLPLVEKWLRRTMACELCSQKMPNCDCTAKERELFNELEAAQGAYTMSLGNHLEDIDERNKLLKEVVDKGVPHVFDRAMVKVPKELVTRIKALLEEE